MGEIGRSHDEFMHQFCLWQLRMVVNGYFKRNREMWSATRWQTYNLMCVSMADLKKAGIYKPTDLIRFPWEKDDTDDGNLPDAAEIARMQQEMREYNEQHAESSAAANS